jgi:hypothetical protein
MANSLYPAYVKLDYHSAYGLHSAILPTRAWSPGSPGSSGTFDSWNSTPVVAATMIAAMVDLIKPFYLATAGFDLYTIYTLEDEFSPAHPRFSDELTDVGTSTETEWAKAVQTTFSMRTDLFGIAKLVLLDAPAAGGFDRITSFGASPEAQAIVDEFADPDNAWAGRDGGRIDNLIKITYTLNEKLRKEYRMD